LVADSLASIAAESIVISSAISTERRTLVEKIAFLNRLALLNHRLALLDYGLRYRLALSRASVVCVPDPALSAAPTDLVADGHLARVGVAELVAVDVTDGAEGRALVEEVALLDLDGGLGLALGGAGVHGIADPAVVAELVADGHLASVGIAEAVVVGCAVAAEDAALVELVALVQEGVGAGEGKADKASDGEECEMHVDGLTLRRLI
jgi:hypothetical protein